MSDFVSVKVVAGHSVEHQPDPAQPSELRTSADAPFKMLKTDYDNLGPYGLRAVRKATKEDRAAGDGSYEDEDDKAPVVTAPSKSAVS